MRFSIWVYGVILGVAILILKGLELYYVTNFLPNEVYIALIAIMFTILGIWLGYKLTSDASSKETPPPFRRNKRAIKSLGISDRELEVLEHLALGHSNQEIANKLYISINTVKTHLSSIYQKLEVNRRSMAVKKARSLKLIQ